MPKKEKEITIDLSGITRNKWRIASITMGMALMVTILLQINSAPVSTASALPESVQFIINDIYSQYPEHLGLLLYLFGNPIAVNNFTETSLPNSMTDDVVNIKFFYSPRSVSSVRSKTFTINDLEALLMNKTDIEYINIERTDVEGVNETLNKFMDYLERVPALVINDKYVVNGEIDTRSVLDLVCSEYAEKPLICTQIEKGL